MSVKVSTFASNSNYEKEQTPAAILASLLYVANRYGIENPDDLTYRMSTVAENKSGVDIYVTIPSNLTSTGKDVTVAIDYKIRRPDVQTYWDRFNNTQDFLIEHIQNQDLGWVRADKDVHVLYVFPWLQGTVGTDNNPNDYAWWVGFHMSQADVLLQYAIDTKRKAKSAYNGHSRTSFYMFTCKDMDNTGIFYYKE
jgi:hypothetical protein